MTDVLIKRELLEDLRDAANDCLNHEIMRGNDRNVPAYTELVEQADMALAAPHQPEGDAEKQLVEWARDRFNRYGRYKGQIYGNTDWALARAIHTDLLAYHQRAMAELLNECQRLENLLGDLPRANAELREEVEQLKEESFEGLYNAVIDERDTLRQQLAEANGNADWWNKIACEQRDEANRFAAQRDKLAGLLADVKADYTHAIHWEDMHASMKRIDAALAEVNK